jgi:ATP-binding cassette, subfamily C (CFTR/MRP), member 4
LPSSTLAHASDTQISKTLHNESFLGTVYTSVRFFDTNPVGRILNRFSSDMNQIDDSLPWTLLDFLQLLLMIIGIALLVSIVNPWLFLLTLPLVGCSLCCLVH